MKNTTLGLVGVGRIGVMHAQHLTALAETLHPRGINVRLVLTDVAAEHARTVAGQLGARSVPSVDELIGTGIDGLVVATGTATHPQLITAVVDAGIPVF